MLYDLIKRLLDLVLSVLGLIMLSPFLIFTALAIKFDSPGPIFADTPKRVGKDGNLFKMYKFRSMVENAHEILEKNPKLLGEYKRNNYKIVNDPRITRMGKLIRRFSVDELPQLINIFKGEMSLVGPRAYYPFELEEQQIKYPTSRKYVRVILSGKPGLTGIWQVSGRSKIDFAQRVKMDAVYVEKRNILYDIILILKTIPAVLSGKGAI